MKANDYKDEIIRFIIDSSEEDSLIIAAFVAGLRSRNGRNASSPAEQDTRDGNNGKPQGNRFQLSTRMLPPGNKEAKNNRIPEGRQLYKRDGKILPGNRKKELWKGIRRNYCLYLFLLPAVVFIGIFCYAPMYGVLMAFQDYSPGKGILGSPWVGLKWFRTFFELPRFWQIVKNTLVISLYSLVVGFPIPILLALMINQR